MTNLRCVNLIIRGRVQGVFFRRSTFDYAQSESLSLKGFIRNLPNGDVEVMASGEEENVQRLIEYCSHGPKLAQVTDISITELTDFDSSQLSEFCVQY